MSLTRLLQTLIERINAASVKDVLRLSLSENGLLELVYGKMAFLQIHFWKKKLKNFNFMFIFEKKFCIELGVLRCFFLSFYLFNNHAYNLQLWMRHGKVFIFAPLCMWSLGIHKELVPGSPMGTKIHANTSPLYRVVSFRWPFVTMGSILPSTVGSVYGCGTPTYRGLSVMFYFLTLTAFNVLSLIFVFSGLNIICLFLVTFILFRYQWISRPHYYFLLFTIIGKLLLLSLQNSVFYSLCLLPLGFQFRVC